MNDTGWIIFHFKLIITCKWFWQSDPIVLALGLSWSIAFNSSLDTFIKKNVYLIVSSLPLLGSEQLRLMAVLFSFTPVRTAHLTGALYIYSWKHSNFGQQNNWLTIHLQSVQFLQLRLQNSKHSRWLSHGINIISRYMEFLIWCHLFKSFVPGTYSLQQVLGLFCLPTSGPYPRRVWTGLL